MAVLLVGTLDTKGTEYAWVRDRITELGLDVVLVDAGVLGTSEVLADVSSDEVVRAGGSTLAELRGAGDRGTALHAVAEGASRIASDLFADGRVDGFLGLGGSGGSSVAAAVMRALPVGVPKLLVSTIASGDVGPYVGQLDVTMMYSVVDVAGINSISVQVLDNAAGAIAGMARAYSTRRAGRLADATGQRPLIAATMFGVTTQAVETARARLEDLGYEVLVFHATGSGGRSMEALIASGLVDGVLDITTTELADELVGGVLSAGPDRLTAAGAAGIPQVVSVGALDMVNFGPADTVPEQFAERNLLVHNDMVTLMRTTADEMGTLGRQVGEKVSRSQGGVSVFLPLRGVSVVDAEGGPFRDAGADRRCFDGVREHVSALVDLVERDESINDEAFALAMADRLDELMKDEPIKERA